MKSSTVKLEALYPGLLPRGRQAQNTVSFSDRGRKQPLWGTTAQGSKYSSPKAPATSHAFCKNEGLSSHPFLYLLVVTHTSVSVGWMAGRDATDAREPRCTHTRGETFVCSREES